MIYLDISRTMARIDAQSPTGMDRFELDYIRFFLRVGQGFVFQYRENFFQVPRWLVKEICCYLASFWESADAHTAKPSDLIQFFKDCCDKRFPGSNKQKFLYHVDKQANILGRAMYLAPRIRGRRFMGTLPQRLFVYFVLLFNPKLGRILVLRRNVLPKGQLVVDSDDRNHVYLNVAHAGLENIEQFELLQRHGCTKVGFFIHDILPITSPMYFTPGDDIKHKARMRTVREHGDIVFANSEYTREKMMEICGITESEVLQIGVSDVFTREKGSPVPQKDRSGFVVLGTLEPRKNQVWLVESWILFCERFPDLVQDQKLKIFGRIGWLDEAAREALIERIDSHPNIELHLSASDAVVSRALRQAKALLSAAHDEGWGMPLAEALSLGTPVLVSDIQAHREVTRGFGTFFSKDDRDTFFSTLEYFFDAKWLTHEIERISGFVPWNWEEHFEKLLISLRQHDPQLESRAIESFKLN